MAPHLLPYRFRWVFCQLEVLRHCLPASIRQTLEQLPESLDATYLHVLSQIPQANQAHAHRLLQCLMVAVRPLYVEELAEVLALEFDVAQGVIPTYCIAWQLDNQTEAILSTCSSLVAIVEEHWSGRQVVQFSHFSVKEFLISNRLGDFSRYHIHPVSGHIILTQACLSVLLHLDDHTDKESANDFPLVEYAARHWVEHAQFRDVASYLKTGVETLFDADKPHFTAWLRIYNMDNPFGRYTRRISNPLYYSVLCGFYDLVKQLIIKHPQHVNVTFGRYKFPLLAALGEEHIEVAELLLEHGANVDARDTTGETILLKVLSQRQRNPVNKVKLLLKQGADVNVRDGALTSPLHLAEYGGELEVAEILIQHKADVNSPDNKGMTPLHILSERLANNENCVFNHARFLIEHGADVNRRDNDNETPLHLAIRRAWFKFARTLLGKGADFNAENNKGKTPLHILPESHTDNEENALNHARVLFEFGADVNRRDNDNETSLQLAIRRAWFKLSQVFLEHGANATTENNKGRTLLHILSESRTNDEGSVLNHALLLLKLGVEVNKPDEDNETPLHLATRWNQSKLAELLLEHGADASVENNRGETPLHILSKRWMYDEDDVVNHARLLLDRGAEVNRRDKDNKTPLHLAMMCGRFKLSRFLLEHGADANAEDNNGMSPLHLLSQSHLHDGDVVDIIRPLLEHGAAVNRRDKNNQTPLLLAVERNWFKLAQTLSKNGADINTEINNGKTRLSHFPYNFGPIQIAQALLGHNTTKINVRNEGGENFLYQESEGESYIQCEALSHSIY